MRQGGLLSCSEGSLIARHSRCGASSISGCGIENCETPNCYEQIKSKQSECDEKNSDYRNFHGQLTASAHDQNESNWLFYHDIFAQRRKAIS
jgi:hypothetical protein